MSNSENLLNIDMNESPNPTNNIVYPPLIEYNFSWDETGMKLSDLWIAFEIAFCEKKAIDCQDELYDFINVFIEAYKDWKPTQMADSCLYVSEYKKSTGDYKHSIAKEVSLSEGHPFRFVRGFMNWVKCMASSQSDIRDIHKIERVVEILSRSPHNRVLLRCNQIATVLLNWFNDISLALSSFSPEKDMTSLLVSIQNLTLIVYNFLPSLNSAPWLTLSSAFSQDNSNLLPILNSVFGEFRTFSLEGHEECLIDFTWELTVIIAKLYELLCTYSLEKPWVQLLHQLILITADSITLSTDVQRSVKVLEVINKITKNLGTWLFGKTSVTQMTDNELISLNVDFAILLINACSVNEITRKEANRLECYQMINQALVYLIKNALAKKEIAVKLPEKREVLKVETPLNYHMLDDGLAKLTPGLFHPEGSSMKNSWNLLDQVNQLSLSGIENTFIDVISRVIVSSIVGSVINHDLFNSYLITFNNIELFNESDRNIVEILLLSVLHSMCRMQPLLYVDCVSKQLIPTLLSSKFLVKIDCDHFTNVTKDDMVESVNEDKEGADLVTVFVRYNILNFIFESLKHADIEANYTEVLSILNAFANKSFDDLCIIDICNRMKPLVLNNNALLKKSSLPEYLIYCLFSSNHNSPLTWPAKYAMLSLLDSVMNNSQVLVDLILSMGIMVNNSLKNMMEYLFNLIDSKKTVEFGAALIIDIILIATNNEAVDESAFGQIMNIFVNMGTSLSRVHSPMFDLNNSYIMNMLFNIVDYMLLENRINEPQITHKRQDILCKTNFVIHCFSIITTTSQNDEYFSVVYHMLFTLFLMLHENPAFYQEFRHTVQDDQFTSVLSVQNHQYDLFLIESLLNILVDRLVFNTFSFYDRFSSFKEYAMSILNKEETSGLMTDFAATLEKKSLIDSIRIVRPDFLSILLHFILRTEEDLQRNCLLFIKALLQSKNCQLNLISITSQSKGLVDMLLNHLEEFASSNIELVLEIIQCIGKHNITVQQLKKVFRLLHPQDNHRTRYSKQIITMLNDLYSTADPSKPDHSFLLVPPCSGLQITSKLSNVRQGCISGIQRFPGGGYTLSLWFNLSSFYADWIMDGELAVPHLFSIVDNDNAFLVYIKDTSLVIKYYQGGKEVEIPATNLPILENKWYHIVISQANKHSAKVHPLFLSLNGECNFECNCIYPTFTSSPKVYVGTRGVDLIYTNLPLTYTEFKGELGTMYLMNKAVDKVQARGMYLLGPNYMFNFEDLAIENRPIFEVTSFSQSERAAITQLCNGSLTPSILMNLSACVVDDVKKSVFDNTPPRFRQQKWSNAMMGSSMSKDVKDQGSILSVNGTLLEGTYVCLTKQIPSVLDSLGGVSLYFPLLTQLDLYEAGSNETAFAEEFSQKCYELLCNAVVKSSSAQLFMTKNSGYDVLAYLLQKNCPYNLTESLLSQLISLIQQSSITPELQQEVFKAFILNSSLWVYSPLAIQKQLYEYILSILKMGENKPIIDIIKSIGLEGYCHTIRYFYCDMEIEINDDLGDERQIIRQWLALDDEYNHPLTNAVAATKLKSDEKKVIRKLLFDIILELLKGKEVITKSGCFYIANSILWCIRNKDMELMLAFLGLLEQILRNEGSGAFFLTSMSTFSHVCLDLDVNTLNQEVPDVVNEVREVAGGILPLFLSLFALDNKEVTVPTLKIVLYIVSLCEKAKDGHLWKAIGVSREHSHVIMDFIASHCTCDMIDEEIIRLILTHIMGTSQLEDNDNLTIQIAPLIPLFLQLLPLIEDKMVIKYYDLFIDVFSNNQGITINLNQLLNLPFWYDYVFGFVCHIRETKKESMDSVWSRLQTLLVSVVMSSAEKNMYAMNANIAELRKDTESVKLLSIVFTSIKNYIGICDANSKSYDKGFFADFFVLIVNRVIAALGMPGDMTGFLISLESVIQYLYDLLVSMLEIPVDEDELEVERDHYQWQLISPFHNLITKIVETLSHINPDIRQQKGLNKFKQTCYTLNLSLLLTLLGRYNLIINDHCASCEEEAIAANVDDLLGGVPPQPAMPAMPAMPVVSQSSAIDDLLGGLTSQPAPLPTGSALDDLLGAPAVVPAPAPQPESSLDTLLGLPAAQPEMDQLGVTTPAPIYVTTPMEEKYQPLYNEAINIAKTLKLFVNNNELPSENIVYLSRLNDALRTLISESSLISADDFKATLSEIASIILKRVEDKAREILKQVDESKPKRKWLLSDKQKEQAEKYGAIGKELNDMLILPPEEWAEKNTHLCKAIDLLQLKDDSSFFINIELIRQRIEASSAAIVSYTINSPYAVAVINAAMGFIAIQEKNFEVRCLKDGAHNFWRKHQITVKRWSTMVESLIHERGPWGELKEANGILTLSIRCNEMGMRNIIVKDPNGTTHPDASVWNEDKGPEVKEEPKIINLIQNSVDTGDDMKELDQELMTSKIHKARIVFSEDCFMVTPMLTARGKLDLSDNTISFTLNADFEREFKEQIEKQAKIMENNKRIEGVNKFTMLKMPENKIWKLSELVSEEYRLYLFRDTAVELFFQDATSFFFSFNSSSVRNAFHNALRRQVTPNLSEFLGATPTERYAKDDCTRRWLNREMSTFEYLMRLNRLAGRTYNDLSQYYVFPWVIADYSSETIDLANPEVYRNFDFPMGAQLDYRREALKEKFDIMKDNFALRSSDMDDRLGILCPPPRFFSVHYSNSANVLWYLIRLEPFTSLHIFLQDGKFDRPDRQFWSMKNTYNGCTTNDGDVKELIPEFYYLPDFLKNANHINLGIRQDSSVPIDDVQLPPWAKTPEDFIRINREALEGEYVSMNIHKWIDLIFGYKQKGPDAEACYNVFSHVSYYGALNMEGLARHFQADWQQAADMLENFGQTPVQLFGTPHKARKPLVAQPPIPLLSYRNWTSPHGCRHLGAMTTKAYPQQTLALYETNIKLPSPALTLGTNPVNGSVMVLTQDRHFVNNPVKQQNGKITPFDLGVDPLLKSNKCPVIGDPFSPLLSLEKPSLMGDQLTVFSHNGQYVCMSGVWDNSVKIINTQTGLVELSLSNGQDIITCIELSTDDSILVTGSLDNTVVVYQLGKKEGKLVLLGKKVLYGHDGAVTCVSINKEMNLLCSGSRDGTIIVYSLSDASYLRTIYDADYDKKLPAIPAISWCGITNEGTILWYSQLDFKFHLYSLIGEKIFEKEMNSQLNSITLSNDRQYVLAAGDKITLFMMRLYDFAMVVPTIEEHFGGEGKPSCFTQVPNLHASIRSLRTSRDDQFIFLGLENGKVFVAASSVKN